MAASVSVGRQPFFSDHALEHLRTYNPHGAQDKSLLLKWFLNDFYNWFESHIPVTVAPNVVTLVGWLPVVFSWLLMTYFSSDLVVEAPGWVYWSAGVIIIWYQTLDNCDGKHAKRTKSGSPLGHLFDHGCDALSNTIVGLQIACSMQFGYSSMALLVTASGGFMQSYFATWEELYTGSMILGYFNGPIEGLLVVALVLILTGIYGPGVWNLPACDAFWHPAVGSCPFTSLSIKTFLVGLTCLITIGVMIMHVGRVFQHCRNTKTSFIVAISKLAPLFTLVMSAYVIIEYSQSGIAQAHGFILFCAVGLTFAYFITRMFLSHLSDEDFAAFNPLMLPWLLQVSNIIVSRCIGQRALSELLLLDATLIWAVCTYSNLVVGAVTDFRDRLGIPIFTIPKSKAN